MFCKNCGKEIADDAKFCDGCGASVDGSATINTNLKSNEFEKYLLLARRAADSGNNADAAKYYGLAQTENPNDWESLFYGTYHTAMQTNIAGIASAATLVVGSIEPTVSLIDNHTPENEQVAVATQMVDSCVTIATMLLSGAINHYNGIDSSIRSKYENELETRANCARAILTTIALCLDKTFGDDDKFAKVISSGYQASILMHENNTVFSGKVDIEELKCIAKYDKEFAAKRLQPRIEGIESSIKNLSKPTTNNGCSAAVWFVLCAVAFVIGFTGVLDNEILFFVIGGILGFFGIICLIPFKKSEKRLAQDAEKIEKLEEEKAEIESLIKE